MFRFWHAKKKAAGAAFSTVLVCLFLPDFRLSFHQLLAQCVDREVSSFLKGFALLFGKNGLSFHFQFYLHQLILPVGRIFVKPEEHLGSQDIVIDRGQLLHLGVDKVQQLLVRVKSNGMHLNVHLDLLLFKPWDGPDYK